LPAGGRVEEVEVEGESEDGDLEEIEKTEGVDAGGVVIGAREKNHEDGGGPDEVENVRGPGNLNGGGDEALVVGADGLREGFEGERGGKEEPDLSRVAGGAASNVEGAEGGEEDHGEVEGVGEEELGGRRGNKFEIEDEEQRKKKSGRKGEAREFAGGGQRAPCGRRDWENGESLQQKGISDGGYRISEIGLGMGCGV